MRGMIDVLENANSRTLYFTKKSDAEAFAAFMRLYIGESAPGNGYGAYWPDGPVIGTDRIVGRTVLNADLVSTMAHSICNARNAGRAGAVYLPETGQDANGGAVFRFDPTKLPPRQKPAANDLVRIVDHPEYDRQIARVQGVDEKNDRVLLCPCPYGIEKSAVLPLKNVMKIHDFLNGE